MFLLITINMFCGIQVIENLLYYKIMAREMMDISILIRCEIACHAEFGFICDY